MSDLAGRERGEQPLGFSYPCELSAEEIEQAKRMLNVDAEAYLLWLAGDGPNPCPSESSDCPSVSIAQSAGSEFKARLGGKALFTLISAMNTTELPESQDSERYFHPSPATGSAACRGTTFGFLPSAKTS